MNSFELILEDDSPVAAVLSEGITDRQLCIIYGLLPERVFCQWELYKRWAVDRVIASEDWTQAQLRRKPMFKPKGVRLGFL